MEALKYYYERAKTKKENFKDLYNQVIQYTDFSYYIDDRVEDVPTFRDTVDPVVSTAITAAQNYTMSLLFSRGDKWATVEVNETVYKDRNASLSQAVVESSIYELNKQLEKVNDTAFDYINSSNFYTEVSKAIREMLVLGVSCIKISKADPFVFEYVSIDNLYFLEDALGRPEYVFKKHKDLSIVDLKLMFGRQIRIPDSLTNDYSDRITVIESVVPEGTGYIRRITTEGFTHILLEEKLRYNPFALVRWTKEQQYEWACGLGVQALNSFKDLKKYKDLKLEQAEQLVKPPLKLTGDKALIHAVKFEAGYLNYGGEGTFDPLGNSGNGFDIAPIQTNITLVPADQEILRAKQEIQELFMSEPLGSVEDFKTRTATEASIRYELFRRKYSGSFETIQQELMSKILFNVITILIETSFIDFNLDKIDNFELLNVQFVNELTKNAQSSDVDRLVMAMNTASQAGQLSVSSGLDYSKTIEYVLDTLNIPLDLRLDEEALKSFMNNVTAVSQQILAEELVESIKAGVANDNQAV
jgi:hypothetical protein